MSHLVTDKRFFGLFWTQFLGAFNDNVFKNSVALLIAFAAASEADAGMWVNMAGGLFILPWILFSPLAGQLSDKYDKARILRMVKLAEIPIMMFAGVGFYLESNTFHMITIFLMGSQSAFFGPAKYSILPQHLKEEELTAGNGLISMSTFVSIIFGIVTATIFVGRDLTAYVPIAIVGVAGLGYFTSRLIPDASPTDSGLVINYNLFTQYKELWGYSKRKQSVHLSIFGISWLWFLGSVILTQMPAMAKFVLNGTEEMSTLLILVFVTGIGIGSMLCIKLSRGEIELGLVPLGCLGMSLFGLDLLFIDYSQALQGDLSIWQYAFTVGGFSRWRLLADITLVGLASSFYIIPLYALIQARSEEAIRSRIFSANNILNSFFMVSSAVFTMGLYAINLKTPEIFAVFFAMNLVVGVYMFSVVPEFVLRFGLWILASFIYRIRYTGRDLVPRNGGAVIVANHLSFIDWFIITATCRRPVRFVMDHNIFRHPILGPIFRLAKAIPIAPAKEDAACKEQAFHSIKAELEDGNLVCIFPEGVITKTGDLMPFKPGVERILAETPVPVIPIAIQGLWGSWFSRYKGSAMKGTPTPSHREIQVEVGPSLPSTTKAAELERNIAQMLGDVKKAS